MKKLCLGLVAASVFALNANATLVSFDELSSGSYGSGIISGIVKVTDIGGNNVNVLEGGSGGTGYVSPRNCIAANSWNVGDGLFIEFSELVNGISIVGGDAGGDQDGWSMEAYGASMNLLGSVSTGVFSGADPLKPLTTTFVDYRTLSLDVSDVKYVKLIQNVWGTAWDNLEYNTVANTPEPASLSLLLLGFGALGFAFRRKK